MRIEYRITGRTEIPFEHEMLAIRRVRPFLNTEGLTQQSVERLMCEAYIQGLRDAAQALEPDNG